MKTLWDLKFCFKVAFLRLETYILAIKFKVFPESQTGVPWRLVGNLWAMPKCMFERSEKLSKMTKFYALLCTFVFAVSKTFEANMEPSLEVFEASENTYINI